MPAHQPLKATELYTPCDLDALGFETTDDLEPLDEVLGQERAVEAVHFGAGIPLEGYNLFVLGPPGSGRHSFVRQFLERRAAAESRPRDWCYVNNFEQSRAPRALSLPAGMGRAFREDIEHLIEEARSAIPAAFESEDYQTRRSAIEEELKEEQQNAINEIQEHAREKNIGIIPTPTGFAFAPIRDGETLSPKEFQELPEDERERIEKETEKLGEELRQVMREAPKRTRAVRKKIRELNREVTVFAVGSLIDELRERYQDLAPVVEHLEAMQQDIVDNVKLFIGQGEGSEEEQEQLQALAGADGSPAAQRYAVNLIVDHADNGGAPVVFEDHPTHNYLVGQVEHISHMGTLITDFSLIKAGALHQANGGYLVLDARRVLTEPFSWDALKRILKAGELRIQSPGQAYSLISTVSLEPEAIPLDVKIVLIGDRWLYYLLQALDPEFDKLFKVAADFDDQMDRNPDNVHGFARLLGNIAREEKLLPLTRDAVARVVEHSARHAGDAAKLSAEVRHAADVVREAHFWAAEAGHDRVSADDVQAAIDARLRRSGRIRDRLHEEILRETILVDTDGKATGQVNGLSVLMLGDSAFGKPSRITARIAMGSGQVVDIEREVELGGPIHSKGVMILAGFLAANYVTDRPLSLSATLVFEQSYGGIEGDSASTAELCALLSAIADTPLRQDLAITGSVNQRGRVQAIGGVNEKIEGFFDICQARGLTGDQGVLVPRANVKHLMLRRDVREAADRGAFHVYAVDTVDDALELLTGLPAGERDARGGFPEGSINRRIADRLVQLAEQRQAFSSSDEHEAD